MSMTMPLRCLCIVPQLQTRSCNHQLKDVVCESRAIASEESYLLARDEESRLQSSAHDNTAPPPSPPDKAAAAAAADEVATGGAAAAGAGVGTAGAGAAGAGAGEFNCRSGVMDCGGRKLQRKASVYHRRGRESPSPTVSIELLGGHRPHAFALCD